MNWYKKIKLAFPYKEMTCLKCHTTLIVDLGEKIGTTMSRNIEHDNWAKVEEGKETGEVIFQCPKCFHYFIVDYSYDSDSLETEITGLERISRKDALNYMKMEIPQIKALINF